MVNTTMHFMPGCEILRSYDLVNWEHASYVYDTLDSTKGQTLQEGNIYGRGMWAASLRYHKDTFYICFVANDTHKTYLYTAKSIEGPWEKKEVEGFYHDCSLLFDEDDKVYIAYGNRTIYITELKPDLSGPLEGGIHRVAVQDTEKAKLGYEGTHFYKINGKYYLFFIHSLEDRWFRTESCFVADSITGEFTGRDVLCTDRNYCGQGVAQGAIVDTPEGKWYAILFQDSGAIGRMPILMPMTWKDDFPVLGDGGRIPEYFQTKSTRPGYIYNSLVQSDDFKQGIKPCWQFNHEPDLSLVEVDQEKGQLTIKTNSTCNNITEARNTLTQRMLYPGCSGEITVSLGELQEGDYAGISAFIGAYGMIAATVKGGKKYLVMRANPLEKTGPMGGGGGDYSGMEWAQIPLEEGKENIRLRVKADFTMMKDQVLFYYLDEATPIPEWKQLGISHQIGFRLDHFCGARFGLFMYSTKESGGKASFSDFIVKQ